MIIRESSFAPLRGIYVPQVYQELVYQGPQNYLGKIFMSINFAASNHNSESAGSVPFHSNDSKINVFLGI